MKRIYVAFISFVLLSCSNENVDNTTLDVDNTLDIEELSLKQVNVNGLVSKKYSYQNNLIASIEYYDSGELNSKEIYEYSNDTIFRGSYDSLNEFILDKKYYSVTEDMSKIDSYNSENEISSSLTYNFNNNSCGYVSLESYSNRSGFRSKRIREYVDSNCNIEDTVFNSDNEVLYKQHFTFDDKNRFDKSVFSYFFKSSNYGNTITYTYYDDLNVIDTELSYKSSFEYNDHNYPISESREYLDGTLEEFTFEYY